MKCKNCDKDLTHKQKQYCSIECYYEWKRNQPSKLKTHVDENNKLKEYTSKLTKKDDIYKFISNNIFKFNTISNLDESSRILRMIDAYSLNVPRNIISWKELYDYLKNKSNCEVCNNESRFNSFTSGYYKFCSNECKYKWRSLNMLGDKNNFHKVSDAVRKRIGKENGERLKQMIKEGTFTPNVTNSWARSKCVILIKDKEIKLRSSWEAYFQLYNPTFEYEKLRIPYFYNKKWHNYIIDFIDNKSKSIYEIKPSSESNNELNSIKRKAAIKWASDNNYNYIEINDDWFKVNYDEELINGQEDSDRLKKLLSQFNK